MTPLSPLAARYLEIHNLFTNFLPIFDCLDLSYHDTFHKSLRRLLLAISRWPPRLVIALITTKNRFNRKEHVLIMETFLGQLTHLAEVLHTPLGWGNCDAFVYAWVNLARETLFKMLTSLRKLAWAGVEEAWFMDEGVD